MERRKRIALYGGTFDPVHIGHSAVAHSLLKVFALDEVLFIPAHVAPHKREMEVTPALDRYAMLALATEHESRFLVSKVELEAPERPYTFETLSRMQQSLGHEAQLFFVMGADSWLEITTWREWERVLNLSDHIVVTRPGYSWREDKVALMIRERVVDLRGTGAGAAVEEVDDNADPKVYLTDAVNMDVSATVIRQAVREKRDADWTQLVAPAVAEYIRKYGLYK